MPRTALKRRRTFRKRGGRTQVKRGALVALNRSRYTRRIPRAIRATAMGQPKRKLIKFKYFDTVTLDPSAVPNTPAKHVFRGNDLYDPDYTGTGHQPYVIRFCYLDNRLTSIQYGFRPMDGLL